MAVPICPEENPNIPGMTTRAGFIPDSVIVKVDTLDATAEPTGVTVDSNNVLQYTGGSIGWHWATELDVSTLGSFTGKVIVFGDGNGNGVCGVCDCNGRRTRMTGKTSILGETAPGGGFVLFNTAIDNHKIPYTDTWVGDIFYSHLEVWAGSMMSNGYANKKLDEAPWIRDYKNPLSMKVYASEGLSESQWKAMWNDPAQSDFSWNNGYDNWEFDCISPREASNVVARNLTMCFARDETWGVKGNYHVLIDSLVGPAISVPKECRIDREEPHAKGSIIGGTNSNTFNTLKRNVYFNCISRTPVWGGEVQGYNANELTYGSSIPVKFDSRVSNDKFLSAAIACKHMYHGRAILVNRTTTDNGSRLYIDPETGTDYGNVEDFETARGQSFLRGTGVMNSVPGWMVAATPADAVPLYPAGESFVTADEVWPTIKGKIGARPNVPNQILQDITAAIDAYGQTNYTDTQGHGVREEHYYDYWLMFEHDLGTDWAPAWATPHAVPNPNGNAVQTYVSENSGFTLKYTGNSYTGLPYIKEQEGTYTLPNEATFFDAATGDWAGYTVGEVWIDSLHQNIINGVEIPDPEVPDSIITLEPDLVGVAGVVAQNPHPDEKIVVKVVETTGVSSDLPNGLSGVKITIFISVDPLEDDSENN